MKMVCSVCGKGELSGYNRPKSLHKTKRKFKPNLITRNSRLTCSQCLKHKSA